MGNVNDFIHGGKGVTSAKFQSLNDACAGTILDFEVSQCRDFKTNDPEWWDEEKTQPKEQLVITLQTDQRDGDEDDGKRRLFAKKPGNMLTAIADALDTAGAEIAKGGRLAVVFTGEKPHENPKFNNIKEYAAAYEAPAKGQADALLNGAGSNGEGGEQVAGVNPAALLG